MKEKNTFDIVGKLQNLGRRKIQSIAKTATISDRFRYEGEGVNEDVDLARGSKNRGPLRLWISRSLLSLCQHQTRGC